MFAEKNFEMITKFALSSVEMINVRGGDGEGGTTPEDPAVKVKI